MTMWERLRRWFALPALESVDEETRRMAVLLNVTLWAEMGVVLVASPLILVTGRWVALIPTGGISLIVATMLFLLRKGRVRVAGNLFVANLWLIATALMFSSGGLNHQASSSYFIMVLVAGLLFGGRAVIWSSVVSGISVVVAFVIQQMGGEIPTPLVGGPAFDLAMILSSVTMVAVLLFLSVRGLRDALTRARQSAVDLQAQGERLQTLFDERSHELARRTGYLGATTAVAQAAQEMEGNLPRLLPHVVNVISDQFGFYHTGLFLLDARKEWMVLQAASSEGGQRMLARQHRLQVGSQSIVGYVAARGQRRIALDVGQDAVYFDTPDLPDTRSEMAVPLHVRGEVLGVLDVQSTEPQAFTDEDVTTLQALADQVAMAVSNAQLLQQVEASLEAERRAYGEQVRDAWSRMLQARQDLGFYDDGVEIVPAGDLWRTEMEHALSEGDLVRSADDSMLALPIRVRDQVVGVLDGRKPDGTVWSSEEIVMLQTLTDQLSAALEGAQLYEDSQRRAARERITREITDNIRVASSIENAMKRAVQEMARVLHVSEMVARLGTEHVLLPDEEGAVHD